MKNKIFKSKEEVMIGIRECRFDDLHDIIPLYNYLNNKIKKYKSLSINDVFLTTYYYYKYSILISSNEELLMSKNINDKSDLLLLQFDSHAVGWTIYDGFFNIKLDKINKNWYLYVSEPHKI